MKTIPLTKGYSAIVDDDIFEYISKWKWYSRVSKRTVYAARSVIESGVRRMIYMHRLIMSASEGQEIDHRDSNGLNNQKHNLRSCSRIENGHNIRVHHHNKSGLKGAWFCKERKGREKPWLSQITVNKKCISLGRFSTSKEAAKAYDIAAVKYFGEFARTNSSMGLLKTT